MAFRSRDRALYIAFVVYAAIQVGAMSLVRGTWAIIDVCKAFGTFSPVIALCALVTFQFSIRPHCPPRAFCIVFAGIVVLASIAIVITSAISTAI